MLEVTYRNVRLSRHKQMQNILGTLANTVVGFIVGVVSFAEGVKVEAQVLMLLYSIFSLTMVGYLLPQYMSAFSWLDSRNRTELVELVRPDVRHVVVNGIEWDVALGEEDNVILDCYTGIAYLPTLSLGLKSTKEDVEYAS